MKQEYIYAPLRKKREVKYPNFIRPGDQLKITSIHPNDSHFNEQDKYLNKTFVLAETPEDKLFARSEASGYNPTTRTYVACNIKIKDKIEYFTAVKIERAFIVDKAFKSERYRNEMSKL